MFLCLDYGSRYIGVAATDYEGRIPYRYGVIDQKETPAVAALKEIVEKERIVKILLGVPISLEGKETQQTHDTLAFMEQLQQALGEEIEIEPVDETLTSVEAQLNIKAEGGQASDEHAEAARLMLVDYLAKQL